MKNEQICSKIKEGGKREKSREKNKRQTLDNRERKKKNKAGYTAQDAPSMRTFHLRKITRDIRTYGRTDGRTDTTFYRDA